MGDGLVSVVMPVWNGEQWLDTAVRSVLKQTWRNWELLIVDDGSTDGTSKVLDRFTDPRIRRFWQPHSGVSTARNLALEAARGEYMTLLDSDDALPARSLECRVSALRGNPGIDLVDGRIVFKDAELREQLRSYQPSYYGPLFPRFRRLDSHVFVAPFYLFRRSLVGALRFDADMKHAEDQFFFLRLSAAQEVNYGFVKEEVYHYRVRPNSAMSSLDGIDLGYRQLVTRLRGIPQLTAGDCLYLRIKLAKVMALSRLHARQPFSAVTSALSLLFAGGGK